MRGFKVLKLELLIIEINGIPSTQFFNRNSIRILLISKALV